jgi:ethanolamine permease
VTHKTKKTPHVALLSGSLLGYLAAFAIHRAGSEKSVGAILLNMAVFGAVISYVLQMSSFLLLRKRAPRLERPYKSPLGVPGAVFALVVALVTLASLFRESTYRWAALGAALWFLAGLVYFAVWGRKQLVYAPEEAVAEKLREGSL